MGRVQKRLPRQHFLLGSAIALLAACSQPLANGAHNMHSSKADAAGTSVREKPLVSQKTDPATPDSQTALSSCSAGNLQAVLDDFQGAVGSRYARIKFTNTAKTACILQGQPQIKLLNSVGKTLPVRERALQSNEVGSKVVVQPQQHAYLTFSWINWCLKEPNNPIKLVVKLPAKQGQVPVILSDDPLYHGPPPCNGSDGPSSLSVGLFSLTPSP